MSDTTKQPLPAIATIISMPFKGKESNIVILGATVEELNHYLGTQGHEGTPETCYARLQLGRRLEEFAPIDVPGILIARQFAEKLGTRQIGKELSMEEGKEAKEKGLIVVFGGGDDLAEFRGSLHDEVGVSGNTLIRFSKKGKFHDDESMEALESLVHDGTIPEMPVFNEINATYGNAGHRYATEIPHATFDVMEGDELFCCAIVFSTKDLK